MSAPPQKTLPSPASTTARTSSAAVMRTKVSCSRSIMSALNALRPRGERGRRVRHRRSTGKLDALSHPRPVRRHHPSGPRRRYTPDMEERKAAPESIAYALLTRVEPLALGARLRRAGGKRAANFQRFAKPRRLRQERPLAPRRWRLRSPAQGVGDDDPLRAYIRDHGMAGLDRRRDGLSRRARLRRVADDTGLSRSRGRTALASLFCVDRGGLLAGVANFAPRSKVTCAK